MGCYIYINENEQKNKRTVEDIELNELLQEALKYDKTIMLSSYSVYERKSLFDKKKAIVHYSLYHEIFNSKGESMMEARQQISGSGKKEIVSAYLYGIINGANADKCSYEKVS